MRRFLIPALCVVVGMVMGAPLGYLTAEHSSSSIPSGVYEGNGFGIELNLLWTPTYTASPYPTYTPTDTITPFPTITPSFTPGVTDDPFLTPTPTDEIGPVTLVPTFTPSVTPLATPRPTHTPEPTLAPEDAQCFGNTLVNLNFRTEPAGERLGTWSAGQRLEALRLRYVEDGIYINEWALLTNGSVQGWSAVYYRGIEYFEFDPTDGCLLVRFGDGPALAPHTILWTDRTLIADHQRDIKLALNVMSGTKNYVSEDICRQSLASRSLCVQRWPPDWPRDIGGDDPRQSAFEYMEARNGGVQALVAEFGHDPLLIIELVNEAPMTDGKWWDEWNHAALDYADANNWPQLALLGLGPGHGNLHMFRAMESSLRRNHERGGYVSMHNYEPDSCGGDGSLTNGSEWCAYRHRINYDIINHVLGYDVRILITELAPGWGNTKVTPDVISDFGSYYCNVKDDPGLYALSDWIFGPHFGWPLANLEGWGPPLVQARVTCG